MLVGEIEGLLRQLVFAGQSRSEHRRVVGVERDHNALIEIAFGGMFGDSIAHAGPKIARQTDFEGNLPIGKFLDQVGILGRGHAVPDALRVQIERTPDRFRRPGFPGMRRKAKTVVSGVAVNAAEQFGRSFLLVAANAHADDVAVLVANREFEDSLRLLDTELADCIEDPEKRDAEIPGAAGASAVETLKDGGEILLAP